MFYSVLSTQHLVLLSPRGGARQGRPPEHGEDRRRLEDRPPRRLLPGGRV